MVITKINIYEF